MLRENLHDIQKRVRLACQRSGRNPDEAFLNYYLKLPSNVYVSSDGIVELVSQWRQQHPEQIRTSDVSKPFQA